MTIHYDVQAEVIDISTDAPKSGDSFLVDTNVWYWMTYSNAAYMRSEYPKYVNDALQSQSNIHHSGLSLAELTHLIEKREREIYVQYVKKVEPKEYRHNDSKERARVVSEIETAWRQVLSLTKPLDVVIDMHMANTALSRLKAEKTDGYDLFILESMKTNSVVQVITDDGDFVTVPGIQVFTANRNVILAAKAQHKLLVR